jgi:hypothetical protein
MRQVPLSCDMLVVVYYRRGRSRLLNRMHARQVPVSMFTVLFAVARTVGWVAQWAEMAAQQQSAPKISRPRQARAPAPETPRERLGRGSRAARPQAKADADDTARLPCTAQVLVLTYTPGSCP